jgi:hypothetical protein
VVYVSLTGYREDDFNPYLFRSENFGQHWTSITNNLPTTPVHDLVVYPREHDLIIGTHGRGIFVLDLEVI